MKIGAHVSIAGGVFNAPVNAARIGAETFQIFSRSPRGGQPPELTKEVLAKFKQSISDLGFGDFYIHAPYYINFASQNKRIYHGSIEVVRQELERGSKLGARALMTHLGSAKDLGEKQAIKQTIQGIKEVLQGYKGSCQFLIENSAGAGAIIGDTFEEIAEIIRGVEKIKANKGKVGVCYDVMHGFASGYDVRNRQAVVKTLKEFDRIIGLDRLVVIHANDSLVDFASHKDRHANIGKGKIGLAGFQALVKNQKLKNICSILETPWVDGEKSIKKDINSLKRLRDSN